MVVSAGPGAGAGVQSGPGWAVAAKTASDLEAQSRG